jgi:lipopolysaccharide export system protein LptA
MKTLLLICVLAISSSITFGQTPQQATENEITIRSGPITLSGQQVISDSTIGSIKGRGNVSVDIRNGTFKFQANEVEITIDQNAGMITVLLHGNVRATFLQDGSTRSMESNEAKVNIKL